MVRTGYLRESEKRYGRRCMVIEEGFNGIAFPLLGDTIVYLLAMQLGAGNLVLGFISSAIYIAGVILPFVPVVFNGWNQIKAQTFSWLMRSVTSLGYLLILFLPERCALPTLLVVFTLFCMFRMVGIAFNDFTLKSISSFSNRGKVVSEVNVSYQSAAMVTRFVSFLLLSLSFFSTIRGMVTLQMIGVVANLIATAGVARIPCRIAVSYKKEVGVLYQFKRGVKESYRRRRLILRWVTTIALVSFNMSIPFLRAEVGFSSSLIMFYSVSLGLAVVCAGLFTRDIADRIGSRPLVLYSSLFAAVSLLGWCVVPLSSGFTMFFLMGFLTNFFLSIANLMSIRLVTQVMPDDQPIAFNAMLNFITALLALVSGLFAGYLVDVGETLTLNNSYIPVFLFLSALELFVFVLALILKEIGAYSALGAAEVVFSLKGIQAAGTMERLNGGRLKPNKRHQLLLSLGYNSSHMATRELRGILANPFSSDKDEVIKCLGQKPRMALLEDLIDVARDNDSYAQIQAVRALGAYHQNDRARSVLENLMQHGRWASVRAMAARSLAYLTDGDPRYLALINKMGNQAHHIEEEIDFLIASHLVDKSGFFYEQFFLPVTQNRGATFRQTRYAVLASFLKFGSPRLAHIYEGLNLRGVGGFIEEFLYDARDLDEIDRRYDEIEAMYTRSDWQAVRDFSLSILEPCTLFSDPRFGHLRKGILKAETIDISLFDIQDAVALLYFSYSLVMNVSG